MLDAGEVGGDEALDVRVEFVLGDGEGLGELGLDADGLGEVLKRGLVVVLLLQLLVLELVHVGEQLEELQLVGEQVSLLPPEHFLALRHAHEPVLRHLLQRLALELGALHVLRPQLARLTHRRLLWLRAHRFCCFGCWLRLYSKKCSFLL